MAVSLEDRTCSTFDPYRVSTPRGEKTMEDTLLIENETDGNRDEERRVREWQVQQLQGLGLSSLLAQMFVTLVDWHDVAELVDRGCSPELALAIVR